MLNQLTQGQRTGLKYITYLLFFSGVFALIYTQLPRAPYSTDLSRIGAGQPAIVLAYDISSTGAMEVMALMDEVRGEYSDKIEFLVADLGTPAGLSFATNHQGVNGTLMFYTEQGDYLKRVHLPPDVATLRAALDDLIAN